MTNAGKRGKIERVILMENKVQELKVKKWIIDRAQETAGRYNTYIDYARQEDGAALVEDGYITVLVREVLKETEKAVQVLLDTGDVVGSYKGWKVWVPKSQILIA